MASYEHDSVVQEIADHLADYAMEPAEPASPPNRGWIDIKDWGWQQFSTFGRFPLLIMTDMGAWSTQTPKVSPAPRLRGMGKNRARNPGWDRMRMNWQKPWKRS